MWVALIVKTLRFGAGGWWCYTEWQQERERYLDGGVNVRTPRVVLGTVLMSAVPFLCLTLSSADEAEESGS